VTEGPGVVIYDTLNNTVKTVPIINSAGKQVFPYGVAITNDGKKIYVTSPNPEPFTTEFENGHYNAYEIDTTNNYAITPLPTSTASASPPYGIAVDSSGIVYVVYGYYGGMGPNAGHGAVVVIDTLKTLLHLWLYNKTHWELQSIPKNHRYMWHAGIVWAMQPMYL